MFLTGYLWINIILFSQDLTEYHFSVDWSPGIKFVIIIIIVQNDKG